MTTTSDGSRKELLTNVLLPVAHEDDALATARALEPYDPDHVTALHVVETTQGAPDKTPVEQSRTVAAESYDAVRTVFPDANEHTAYGQDIAETIFDAVEAVDATAIAYRPRDGNRMLRFLSGDLTITLVTDAPVPVVALPRRGSRD